MWPNEQKQFFSIQGTCGGLTLTLFDKAERSYNYWANRAFKQYTLMISDR